MPDKVLYFPEIRVPNSQWFTQMLLYWNEVGAIVPGDYINNPERLGPHMRSLVEERLVTQVIPGLYTYQIPNFSGAFLAYLRTLPADELLHRQMRFRERDLLRHHPGAMQVGHRVHLEKLQDLARELFHMGLAEFTQDRWVSVEAETSEDFMAYLAATLGRLDDLQLMPVTDDPTRLQRFTQASRKPDRAEPMISPLRVQLLTDLLPMPSRHLAAEEIRRFKDRYGEHLTTFRRRVEAELVAAAAIRDEALQARHLELFREEASEKIEEIQRRMEESNWDEIVFGKVFAVMAAIPGVNLIFGLGNAVYEAFRGTEPPLENSPYLYAAHAQRKFGGTLIE